MFEEISNLKLKNVDNGKALSVERVVRKLDKDRYSALVYMLWYINEYESKIKQHKLQSDVPTQLHFRQPNLYNN